MDAPSEKGPLEEQSRQEIEGTLMDFDRLLREERPTLEAALVAAGLRSAPGDRSNSVPSRLNLYGNLIERVLSPLESEVEATLKAICTKDKEIQKEGRRTSLPVVFASLVRLRAEDASLPEDTRDVALCTYAALASEFSLVGPGDEMIIFGEEACDVHGSDYPCKRCDLYATEYLKRLSQWREFGPGAKEFAKKVADGFLAPRLDEHRFVSTLESALVSNEPSIPPIAPRDDTVPRNRLVGWKDICHALDLAHSHHRSLKKLNVQKQGPIKCYGRGKQPVVYQDDLFRWYNDVENARNNVTAEKIKKSDDKEREFDDQIRPYGRKGEVISSEGSYAKMGVKKRREGRGRTRKRKKD